jgi:hypothetical protein
MSAPTSSSFLRSFPLVYACDAASASLFRCAATAFASAISRSCSLPAPAGGACTQHTERTKQ